MNGRVEFMNIYGQTLEKLENYFENIGEKNLKLPKFMTGFIKRKYHPLMK